MSDIVLVALIGAVPATLAAVLSWVANRRIAVVHDAVNGGLTAAKDEIVDLKAQIRALKRAFGVDE